MRAANLMVQAYSENALNELDKAVRAKQIVTEAEKPPSSNLYAQLAVLAYQAGDDRTGDLAGRRAPSTSRPPASARRCATQLDVLKKQAAPTARSRRAAGDDARRRAVARRRCTRISAGHAQPL